MIYKPSEIKKSYIKLRDIQLNLDACGIYLLKGPTGCGKTTLLESLVFDTDKTHYIFESEQEEEAFSNSKYNLFSYIPQKITYSEMRVYNYIVKMNPTVRMSEIHDYLCRFDLPIDILENKFCLLSGGEQKKISIIAALAKHAPYIFMDEPTNYMDNSSASAFLEIIKEEAKDKRIFIVTHDPRVEFEQCIEYSIRDGQLKTVSENPAGDMRKKSGAVIIPNNAKPNILKIFGEFTKGLGFRVTGYVFLLFLVFMLVYTTLYFIDSIGEETGDYHDSILVYYVGGGHDALNETYERGENIQVDESDYDNYIDYDEISVIAEIDGVNEIYLPDLAYINELLSAIDSDSSDDILLYSRPVEYIKQYSDTIGDELLMTYTEGNLPEDGMSQVAISKSLLISDFGYTDDTVDDSLGDIISIHGSEYEIVGFSYYDIAIISYEQGQDYGFYCYSEDTFEAFREAQLEYIEEFDGIYAINEILISVDDKDEKSVLNYLVKNYPSNCYISKYFERTFLREQMIEEFCKCLLVNCLFAVIFAVIIWLVVNKATKYNMNIIWDIGNYYVNRRKIMKMYIVYLCAIYVLIGAACALVDLILSEYAYMTVWYILIDCAICIVPVLLACCKGLKEVKT